MDKNKYILTFDFRILYCPSMISGLSCKELNPETLDFNYYEGNTSISHCYELNPQRVEQVVKEIFNGKIGYSLRKDEIDWLEKCDKLLKREPKLLQNDRLMFNYCILKLRLLGFLEEEAVEITKLYFRAVKISDVQIPSFTEFISIIDNIMKKKKFWVCVETLEEKDLEIQFLRKILSNKLQLKHNFNFNSFKEEYLLLCSKSFFHRLSSYNQSPSYLVKEPLKLSDQKSYLFYLQEIYISDLIRSIVEYEFRSLSHETLFLSKLKKDLISTFRLYIHFQDKK